VLYGPPTSLSLTPECPRPTLSFLEIALNWTKSQHFDKLNQFFWIVTIQIQTRHVRDHIGKENTTIAFKDWNIIMLDHQGFKTMKIFELSFCMSNLKNWLPKNVRLKGITNTTPIDLWLIKIYSTFFLNDFLVWFFLQDLVYLRLISKKPQHYRKSRLQKVPLHKILNRKIIITHFQNRIFDAKSRLQIEFFKNINY